MTTERPAQGVRINGGKLHVFRPGLRPITRCGQRAGRAQHIEDGIDSDTVPAADRCRNCFPGTTRGATDPTTPGAHA